MDRRAQSTSLLFALLEHGIMAASMFLLNVVLFNALPKADYGVFVQIFAVSLLLQSVMLGYLLEPVLVGSKCMQSTQHFRELFTVFSMFILVAGGLFLLASLATQFSPLRALLFLIHVFSSTFLFFQRKAMNVSQRQDKAVIGAFLYSFILFGGLCVCYRNSVLSVDASLAVLATSALLVLVFVYRIWPVKMTRRKIIEVHRLHKGVARWMSLAAALQWIPNNLAFFLLPLVGGAGRAGELKALLSLILPLMHFNTVLGAYLPPLRFRAIQEKVQFSYVPYFLLATSFLTVYSLLLLIWGEELVSAIYSKEIPFSPEIVVQLCSIPFVTALLMFLHTELRSLQLHSLYIAGYLLVSALAFPITWLLVSRHGVVGGIQSITSIFIMLLMTQGAMLFLRKRKTERSPL